MMKEGKKLKHKRLSNPLKTRIQKMDKKGAIIINRMIREQAQIPDDSFVYLKPLGRGRVLVSLIGNENQLKELLSQAAELALEQVEKEEAKSHETEQNLQNT